MANQNARHDCAAHLELVEREREFPIHGTTVPVREEVYRCAVCGEEEYSYEQAVAAERRAGEIYREQAGFLQPDEITAMRRRWGVTQAQLETALGLGRKTVARWEAGRVLQTRALDNLLRAIDRFPDVLAYLASRQAVTLEPNPAWCAPAQPGAVTGITLPRSLRERMEREARDEGVSVDVYVVSLLSQGAERRHTARELQRMGRKLDDVMEHVSQWSADSIQIATDEPWLRDHREVQHNRTRKEYAL